MNYERLKQLFLDGVEKIAAIGICGTMIACLYFLGTAATSYFAIEEAELSVNTLTYENFKVKLDTAATKLDASMYQEPVKHSKMDVERMECTPILDEIIRVISQIADNTGQMIPRGSVSNKIYDRCHVTKEYIPIKENLSKLLIELQKFNQNYTDFASYDILDPQYALWTDFLEIYFRNLDDEIKKHNERIKAKNAENNNLELKIDKNIVDAKMLFIVLCICIVFFAIVGIERNTKAVLALRATLNDGNN